MRIILPLIAGYIAYRLIKKRKGAKEKPKEKTPAVREREDTVFDEVCKTYVPLGSALTIQVDGKTHYFCGSGCMERFTRGIS